MYIQSAAALSTCHQYLVNYFFLSPFRGYSYGLELQNRIDIDF